MNLWSLPSRERGLKFLTASQMSFASPVAPLAGAWIEILLWFWLKCTVTFVAPLAGAWIEIMDAIDQIHQLGKSLPSRERGLKYCDDITNGEQTVSLPSRERGLKSCDKFCVAVIPAVAPLAGAWIEIDGKCRRTTAVGSLPSRERGLK